MNAVTVKNLTVAYGQNTVLERVSFDVAKGKIAVVIGPNGSGKTTLFKAILGLIPSQGTIKIFDKLAQDCLDRIGYVPQTFDFDRTLPITVDEFLSFGNPRAPRGGKDICKETKVDALKGKLIGQLSGGQLQRVLIANALMRQPKLLLLDEPAAGIDIEGSKAFYELIGHVNREHGMTVMMISHEINMVYNLADQLICLNRDLVCNGSPQEALTKDVLDKLYGKDSGLRHHHHHPHL